MTKTYKMGGWVYEYLDDDDGQRFMVLQRKREKVDRYAGVGTAIAIIAVILCFFAPVPPLAWNITGTLWMTALVLWIGLGTLIHRIEGLAAISNTIHVTKA